jgi:hypothetical protein
MIEAFDYVDKTRLLWQNMYITTSVKLYYLPPLKKTVCFEKSRARVYLQTNQTGIMVSFTARSRV